MSLKKNVSEIHPPVAWPLEAGGKVKGPQDKILCIQVFKVLSLFKIHKHMHISPGVISLPTNWAILIRISRWKNTQSPLSRIERWLKFTKLREFCWNRRKMTKSVKTSHSFRNSHRFFLCYFEFWLGGWAREGVSPQRQQRLTHTHRQSERSKLVKRQKDKQRKCSFSNGYSHRSPSARDHWAQW